MPNKFLTTTAWVLEPKTLEIVAEVITARLNGDVRDLKDFEFAGSRRENERLKEKPYAVVDGVAVIPLLGVMGKRFNMFSEWSGGVSTQRIQTLIEDALTDPLVAAVVLQIDSPGGSVDGTAELGDWMLANKGIKPVHAYIDGQCCSGALWVASCCDKITGFRSAQVGSLSAVVCHYDRSGQDEKYGVKRTFIVSGEYKRMANDAEPLNEKGTAYLQGFIDRYHAMFVEAVAAGRGMTPEDVQAKFGNGQVHLAAEAMAIGMIDAIGTLPETINAARLAAMEEEPMKKEEFAAKYPELHAELVADAMAQAKAELTAQVKTEGSALVTAEQERLFGLYGKLHGVEAGVAFAKLAGSGMTAAQMEGLEACGFGIKAGSKETTPGTKEKILEGLEKSQIELQAGGGGGAPTDFMAAVDAEVEKSRCTRTEAMKRVARSNPALHEAYKAGQK